MRLATSIAFAGALLALAVPPAAGGITSPVAKVSLTSPANGAILATSQPQFQGTATTGLAVRDAVTVRVYRGSSVGGAPVETLGATPGVTGAWSVTASAPLPDGPYTARAEQDDILGNPSFSNAVTFRVKALAPALTLTHPAAGASISRFAVYFSGQAGDALGDSPYITLYLYRGQAASGSPLASEQVRADGSSWFVTWDQVLAAGSYTAQAVQSDDAGHTTRVAVSFEVVPGPRRIIGAFVTLSRSGIASVPISCLQPVSVSCTATVLVLTAHDYRPQPGGPFGALEVMYVYLQIRGGETLLAQAPVTRPVARLLERRGEATVRVTASIRTSLGAARTASAVRMLYLK